MPGRTRWGRAVFALLLISFLFRIALFVHGFATGTMLPNQDPSPERLAYQQFHNKVGMTLFLGAQFLDLATFLVGMAWLIRWLIRRLRTI